MVLLDTDWCERSVNVTDDTVAPTEDVHLRQKWMNDLDEAFKEKYSEIIHKLSLYDEMLIPILERSDMSNFYRCMDRIVNRYLPESFKNDIDIICKQNFLMWAMPTKRRMDPAVVCRESIKAYRLAVLSFMPNTVDYLQKHPVIKKITVEY